MMRMTDLIGRARVAALLAGMVACGGPVLAGASDRFFALNNSNKARKLGPAERAALVKEAGFPGQQVSGIDNLDSILAVMDAAGLRVFACYLVLEAPGGRIPEGLEKAMEQLAPHRTIVWLAVRGAGRRKSGQAADDAIVRMVAQVAAMADKAGLTVALYPHAGFALETMDDVMRIAGKVDRENVGVTFNLCHFLRVEPRNDWKAALNKAADKLFAVTICGAEKGAREWSRLIMPLDKGSFPVAELLAHLDKIEFRGPIGLQEYGIDDEPLEHLKRSMAAFREMTGQAGSEHRSDSRTETTNETQEKAGSKQ